MERIGTVGWTERTGGRLSRRDRSALMRPLLAGHLANTVGRVRLAFGIHPGRRASIDPGALAPPDSRLARDAEAAAGDLLSSAVLNHSHRAYAWGAALGALERITFDRELLYVAAMLHDTGLPTPTAGVDFTVKSAAIARRVADKHDVTAGGRERIADAICLHHTPGVTREHGSEAYLLSAGAGVDVFGLRSWELPDTIRAAVIDSWPRVGFKREFAQLWRTEATRVPHGRAWFLRRYAVSDITIRMAPFDE